MLISHKKQFIYTKTIKTASTSVESYFERYCMLDGVWEFSHTREEYISETGIVGYRGVNPEGKIWFNHMSAKSILDLIGDDTWNTYFKFCVIRNPFDKLISAFHFLGLTVNHGAVDLSNNRDRNFVERFRNWLRSGYGETVIDRDKYLIDGKICMDYFIRYEDLHSGLDHVCRVLNIPFEMKNVPSLKSGARDRDLSIPSYYDRESIEVVRRLFEFELDYFGYRIPE